MQCEVLEKRVCFHVPGEIERRIGNADLEVERRSDNRIEIPRDRLVAHPSRKSNAGKPGKTRQTRARARVLVRENLGRGRELLSHDHANANANRSADHTPAKQNPTTAKKNQRGLSNGTEQSEVRPVSWLRDHHLT